MVMHPEMNWGAQAHKERPVSETQNAAHKEVLVLSKDNVKNIPESAARERECKYPGSKS